MSRCLAIVAAFALVLSTPAAGRAAEDIDLQAFQPASLQSVFAAAPTAPGAALELAPQDYLARVETVYTGNHRPASSDLGPILAAWGASRQQKASFANFPELEFEDGGKRYWMLITYPAVLRLHAPHGGIAWKAGDRVTLFVRQIGFTRGRPVVLVFLMATPAEVAAELAKPRAPQPATPKSAPSSVSMFEKGQLRFEYSGKRYVLAAATVMDPRTGQRRNLNKLQTSRDSSGQPFHSVMLDFGELDSDNAALLFFVRGPGVYANYQGLEGGLTLNTRILSLRSLTDCTLTVNQLDAQGVRGKFSCRRAAESVPTELEFDVSP